jgi:hypothetical protein
MAAVAVVWTSSAQSGRRGSDSEADKQAHTVSVFFQFVQNKLDLYNRNGCLSYFQNSQFLQEAILEYSEQLCQLCPLQIPNINKVKNPGTDPILDEF